MSTKNKIILGIIAIIVAGAGRWVSNYLNPSNKNSIDTTAINTQSSNKKNTGRKTTLVVSGLTIPWDIERTGPERMLVTERPGTIRQIINNQLITEPLHTFDTVSTKAEEGLMGMSLHPNYTNNQYIYFCYAYMDGNDMYARVVRMTDTILTLTGKTIIIDRLPAAQRHAGCRPAFGPDGMLYVTVGDAVDKDLAQDPTTIHGKTLRMTDTGDIPSDNPFSGSYIWTLGHRNTQGIDRDSQDNLRSSEHGPSTFDGPPGGDEINLLTPGSNYGRPIISHEETDPRFVDPKAIFTPAIAPGSLLVYKGEMFPERTDNLFVGALRGENLWRMVVNPQTLEITEYHKMIPDNNSLGRIREVSQGPDGAIYFTTSNEDGRVDKTEFGDAVYKIHR